jgi:hypothetical protein
LQKNKFAPTFSSDFLKGWLCLGLWNRDVSAVQIRYVLEAAVSSDVSTYEVDATDIVARIVMWMSHVRL